MSKTIVRLVFTSMLCLTLSMVGCIADVDLNKIDTTTSIKASLALPLGSINATIGDFVGDGSWGIYVDSLNNQGIITFRDTFHWDREFYHMDLSQYISCNTLQMNVYDKITETPYCKDGKITGNDDYLIPLAFPLTLRLNGINNTENSYRLDSALIENAHFISNITRHNLPLDWEWIEKVTITLGTAFHRPAGNTLTIYEKGQDIPYGYNQDIPIEVDDFSICLMKNLQPNSWEGYQNNVVDSCNFLITLYVRIPSSAGTIVIPQDASFQYSIGVQFIDYEAIWGMFEPGPDMTEEGEYELAELWHEYSLLKNVRLPLADPIIDMQITTKIAGALVLNGEYLYVIGENGEKINATFDGHNELYKYFNKNEYLALNSSLGDSATMHVLFDKDPMRGHIDRLFTVYPQKIGYKYAVNFNRQETPQLRITDDTRIQLDAICNVPLVFNDGVSLSYSDTITNIDLNHLTLDSLLASTQLVDSIGEANLKLVLRLENSIPLQLRGVIRCLDAQNNVLMDAHHTDTPFRITNQDTIVILSPRYEYDQMTGHWNISPNSNTEIITLTKDMLTTISQIKSIVFEISLDDKSMQGAYAAGLHNIKLTNQQGLRLHIAIGADLEAILNLGAQLQQNNYSTLQH